jgi:hypothetical protein
MALRILKVACIFEDGQNPYLFEFDQRREVGDVVREICEYAKKSDPEKYGFKTDQGAGLWSYVTSENASQLKDGTVLKLCSSPVGAADDLVKLLGAWATKAPEHSDILKRLENEAYDETFSKHFQEKGGVKLLKKIIDQLTSTKGSAESLNVLGTGLCSFYRLLSHISRKAGSNPWKDYPTTFFTGVVQYMSKKGSIPASVVRSSLQIAGAYVLYTPVEQGFAAIYKQGKGLKDITDHIPTQDTVIQEAAIMLINAVILKASDAEKPALFAKLEKLEVKKTLGKALAAMGSVPDSLAHELYVLQTYLLNTLAERARYDYTTHDKDLVEKLAQLNESLVDVLEGGDVATYLGFTKKERPEEDFKGYPGVLALDNMSYFAKQYEDDYKRMVLDQRSRQEDYICPFIVTGKRLSELLLDILDVGKKVDETSTQYLPMFYQSRGSAFEELFGVAVTLLHKTWKEMEAQLADLEKVMGVVRKQLEMILAISSSAGTTASSEDAIMGLKRMVDMQTYDDVRSSYIKKDELSYDRQLASDALISLKAQKRDQYQVVVCEQRFAFMTHGAWFSTIKPRGRGTDRFFARLSPNKKEIRWGDPVERSQIDPLNNPVNLPHSKDVEGLAWVEFGTEVPAVKAVKMNKKIAEEYRRLMFAFNLDQEEWVNFIAEDRMTASIWMDGIRMLMANKRLVEPETRADIDTLVDTEMNLVLLNLHGVNLPQTAPEVPPPPPNLDFVQRDNQSTA